MFVQKTGLSLVGALVVLLAGARHLLGPGGSRLAGRRHGQVRRNPEKVFVKNKTRHRIKIKKVGSIYRPYDYEPKTFNKVLGRGKTVTFESGPAANHNVISKQYIFNSNVGSREGARVATSIRRFGDHCN